MKSSVVAGRACRWRSASPPVAAATTSSSRATPAKTTTADSHGQHRGRVKIAFSAPAADHGWLAAVTKDAKDEAEELGAST